MNTTVFIGVLALLQLICLWASKKASKNVQDQQDYFLASKQIRFFPLLMTFVATQIGGGLILGAAEEAYRFGWSVLLYPLGACLGFALLALGVGKKLAQFQVSTVAELLDVVYHSSKLKKVASLLSIISLFMILMAQVVASRKFMISLGIDHPILFLTFWGIVILYTVMGGLKAVVSIDIIQALFFMFIFSIGFGYILYTGSFSFFDVVETGWQNESFEIDLAKLSGWLFMPLLFMVIEQDMAQRCFAAKSPRVVTKAAGYAAICTLIICIIPVFFGILGKQIGMKELGDSSVFMNVVQTYTNPYLAACIACAVLMAILSTAISLLNAVSSNLSQDFDLVEGPQSVLLSRRMTTGIGLAAVGCSFYAGTIVDLLIQSYELSVYCLFIPVFAALFKKRGNQVSAWLAFAMGGIGFVLTRYLSFQLPKEFICLLLSGLGYLLGELWMNWNLASKIEPVYGTTEDRR